MLAKVLINKNKISNIDIYDNNFDLDVVGPFKLSLKSINILKKIYRSKRESVFYKMGCYTFFGKITSYTNLDYQVLKDLDWYEINTVKEYNKSLKNKIFDINLD